MSASLYKEPKVKRSAGQKRAKVLYERQYRRALTKSVEYEGFRFVKYGAELTFVNLNLGLTDTIEYFKTMYGDTLTPKHAALILYVKYYLTLYGKDMFQRKDLEEAEMRMETNLSPYYANSKTNLGRLLSDLSKLHFLKSVGQRSYMGTYRMKMFIAKLGEFTEKRFKGEL